MNYKQAVDEACKQPTLIDALSWICVWESERTVRQAHAFLNGETPRNTSGRGWDTCFRFLIAEVYEQYPIQRTLIKLK